ncbi:MAG: Hsp33 family molecular chaperone HslO [Wenzhouxiangellaceae bacterium]|nr:Hsp33 family molecular chaperone HslO [Wenzhouxiangellaceae bacterium]
MMPDHLQRLLLERANVRCVVAHIDSVYAEVLERAHYPDALAQMLGEALVVAALCSSGVKFTGRVSLQLRTSGPLKLLLADCTDAGGMRGLARFDPETVLPGAGFAELAGDGILTMTIEPSGSGRTWQGIVPLTGQRMADAVADYFDRSEQLPTRVMLAVGDGRAAGILVQRLPGEADDADGWNRVRTLLETVSEDELLETDAETLLHRLFHEETRRLFPARPLAFHCPCSRERVARVLRGLGEEELESIIEAQGEIDVSCEFCNEQYRFDRLDVGRLLRTEVPESDDDDPSPTVH